MPPYVHAFMRPREPRDEAADAAFDFLAGLRSGRRVTRADLEAADAILAKAEYVSRFESEEVFTARTWLDLMAKVDPNGAIIRDLLSAAEKKVFDLQAEVDDLAADLERNRRG